MTVAGPRVLAFALLLGACGSGAAGGSANATDQVDRTPARPLPVATPSPGPTATAASPIVATRQDDATFLRTVTRELVAAGATLDWAAITAVRAGGSSCDAVLVTAKGETPVAWASIGDLAASDDDRTTTLPLTIAGTEHSLTMRSGAEAERVTSSLGLLEMDCQGG
jgi:hypothetical protein